MSGTRRRTLTTTAGAALTGTIAAGGLPAMIGAASQVTFAYDGITCQAGFTAAIARGFFRDEGLEVNAIPAPSDVRPQLVQGTIDATHSIAWTLVPPFMPAGLSVGDIVATASVQRGGLAIVVAPDSSIRTLAALRGQKVAAGLNWRIMLAEPLSRLGMDPLRDVDWQAGIAAGVAAEQLRSGQIAAAAVADPFATAMETAGTGRILTMNNGMGMMDDYCCAVVMGAALVRSDRPKAAAITRAVMRGNAWAQANKAAAAQLQIEHGHVNATLADNVRAIRTIDFTPSIAAARRDTVDMLMHGQRFGFLDAAMDVMGTVDRIFLPVTGELSGILRLPATGGGAGVGLPVVALGGAALGAALLLRRRA